MTEINEFKEVGHSGGKYTVEVRTEEGGKRFCQVGVSQSSPLPISLFCITAKFDGTPVGMVALGWAPTQTNEEPVRNDLIQVFIASDREQNFGHECPRCKGYWRSPAVPHWWDLTCPYCRLQVGTHHFLTDGQRRFVWMCCKQVFDALHAENDGDYVIDMNAIADEVQKGGKAPPFYYAEKTQQKKFKCTLCGISNDILGKYGYCSSCGYRNNIDLFAAELENLKTRLQKREINPSEFVRTAVSDLDAAGTNYIRELVEHVRMTPNRRKDAGRLKFHDPGIFLKSVREIFDIQLPSGLNEGDLAFLNMMFQRRHVFEHNGGVADAKYIARSGDTSVKVGQAIRESRNNAERFGELLLVLLKNLHEGFHSILPVTEKAIEILAPKNTKRFSQK